MPTKYVRKTSRSVRSTPDILERAAKLVHEEGISYRKAAANFGVDKMTLIRYIKKKKADPASVVGYQSTMLHNQILPPKMEKDLAGHIIYLADMYFGLSVEKCKELAYQYAIVNKVSVPQSWHSNTKAGKQWWKSFKDRHNLSIRKPEPTSTGRASAFNNHNVKEYFNNLGTVLEKYHFTPDRIFNLDETGVTTVQKPKAVVAAIGTKSVGSITSGERGELVTVVYAVCAAGYALAPLLIFPRVNYRDHFIRGGPPGCIGKASRSGWINTEIFVEFLEHIVQLTGCTPERKILIIMDNHESHISIAVIDKARALGIVLLTIPPKTSHKLQPLDVAVFNPFKTGFNKAMDNWMRCNPGKTVTIYDIPALVNEAQMVAMTPRNITSGFHSTGSWPYNSDIFPETAFAPAYVTDRDLLPGSGFTSDDLQPLQNQSPAAYNIQPSVDTPEEAGPSSVSTYVSPQDVLPLPKAPPRKNSNRRRGKTRIYTDTPVREEIEKRELEKNAKKSNATNKAKRALFGKRKKAPAPIASSSSEEDDIEYDDESDSVSLSEETIEPSLGDYVIVLVAGKSRALKYIARIDDYDDCDGEFEGVFLHKVNSKIIPGQKNQGLTFIVNEGDAASFAPDDIVLKLPNPVAVGGSARTSNQLRFDFDFSKFDLA